MLCGRPSSAAITPHRWPVSWQCSSAFCPYEKRWWSVPTSSASSGRPSICMSHSARSPTSMTLRCVERRVFWMQRRDLGRLDAPVDDLEGGLARDLAPDRVDGPERRLVLLVVDAELRAGLLGDDSEAPRGPAPGRGRRVLRGRTGEMRGALSTFEASWRSTACRIRSLALVSTRSPMISATVASTSAARSATSSDCTRSSTSAAAASRSSAAFARRVAAISSPCSATLTRRSSISSRRFRYAKRRSSKTSRRSRRCLWRSAITASRLSTARDAPRPPPSPPHERAAPPSGPRR